MIKLRITVSTTVLYSKLYKLVFWAC